MVEASETTRVTQLAARLLAAVALVIVSFTVFSAPAYAADGGQAPEVEATPGANTNPVTFAPGNPGSLETRNVQAFANGLAFYALAACIVGIVVSAALWAMGSKGQNPGQELTGKKGIVLCCTAAFFVGAANPLINYFRETANAVEQQSAGVAQPASERPGARVAATPAAAGSQTGQLANELETAASSSTPSAGSQPDEQAGLSSPGSTPPTSCANPRFDPVTGATVCPRN